jgi:hypothetical protein
MKSKSILIMYLFSITDIFSPRKLYLITIMFTQNRWNNRMKYGITDMISECVKCFSYLRLFDLQLFGIWDREPLTSSIELPSFWNILLKWRFFYHFEDLCIDTIFMYFCDFEMNNTFRNGTSCDNNFLPIWSNSQSAPSKYEFIDTYVFENIVFFHKKYPPRREKMGGL